MRKNHLKLLLLKITTIGIIIVAIIIEAIQLFSFFNNVRNYSPLGESYNVTQEFKEAQTKYEQHNEEIEKSGTGTVLHQCIDGGEFEQFNEKNKVLFKIKLAGIIVPKIDESFGNEAKEYVCNRLSNSNDIVVQNDIDAKIEITESGTSMYAFVLVDGKSLNMELIEKGYAGIDYDNKFKYRETILEEWKEKEKQAREQNLGIWSL